MDAIKLGEFIAGCRKEKNMTQAALAVKINVTDKAVSRWERGIGFSDINTIEPLADALGVSVLELMKAEKFTTDQVTNEEASEAIRDTLLVAKEQQRKERRNIFTILGALLVLIVFILYLDSLQWQLDMLIMTAAGVVLPLLCMVGFATLLGYGIWRKATGKSCRQTFALALAMLCILILLLGLFFLAGALGIGPVPN